MIQTLQKAIIAALDHTFSLPVYAEPAEKVAQSACFGVELMETAKSPRLGGQTELRASFLIRYYPSRAGEDRTEAVCMGEQLYEVLGVLSSEKGSFGAAALKQEIQEGKLHFFATYCMQLQKEKVGERMGTLTHNERRLVGFGETGVLEKTTGGE